MSLRKTMFLRKRPSRPAPQRLSEVVSRCRWYVHRLHAMSPEEVPHRVAEQVGRALGRLPAVPGPDPGPRIDTELAGLIRGWGREAAVGRFWRQRADEVAAGRIAVFDRYWPTLPSGLPDWNRDAITGYRWPDEYCFDVSLTPRGDEPAEVKYVWELNRLVYLLPVAAHAAHAGDPRAAQVCWEHLESWVATHPPRRGVVWQSGIELAIRVVSLIVVLELAGRSVDPDPAIEHLVGRAVADHVRWIRRFPSRFSSANNHRVAELAGLLVAASAYPGLSSPEEVDSWWSDLEATAQQQFHSDGVPVEQATMYGILVLEWLAICLHLAGRQGRVLSATTRERIQSGVRFLASVTDVRGNAVRFGDDDDSRLLTAARPHHDLPEAVMHLVTEGLGISPPARRAGLSTFAEGGCTVWRSAPAAADEILWVLDHGPLGMGHLAAHAHADTLAVYLHYGGMPVFVDAGTYLYHAADDWRDRLRSTAEHNTVAVAGGDSSSMVGAFAWRRKPRASGRLVTVVSSAAGWAVDAEHDGYAERHGVVHRRRLEGLTARRFRLSDRLERGREDVPFRWSLLLAPGLSAARMVDGWLIRSCDTDVMRLLLSEKWLSSAREEPAWFSASFGRLESSCRLVIEGTLDTPTSLDVDITVIAAPGQLAQGRKGAE